MVDFFGNSSETHVKLDKKAIGTTKDKSSFQDYSLKPLEHSSRQKYLILKFFLSKDGWKFGNLSRTEPQVVSQLSCIKKNLDFKN